MMSIQVGFAIAAVSAALATTAAGCGSASGGGGSTAASTSTKTSSTAASTGAASTLAPTTGTYSPKINPADFVAGSDNRYFPLKPGTTLHYTGVQEDGKTPQTDDVAVTHQTKDILGVSSTVVRDTVSSGGKPVERTFDWYAQDKHGNVWYMGEDASAVKNGRFVRAADSWEAGINGAQPGIIMPGNPQPDGSYRQEFDPGHAEDQAQILGSAGALSLPAGSYRQTLLTAEKAPRVDPGVVERKYYVAGVGEVKERVVSGNHEQIQLVSVTH